MRPRDFEIGKVYCRSSGGYRKNHVHNTFVRVGDDKFIRLSEDTTCRGQSLNLAEMGRLSSFYQISPDDLLEKGKTVYLKYFPKQQSCTCDITDIMIKGCTCGWLEKE